MALTSIIVRRTPDEIVIGADSKRTVPGEDGTAPPVCKIHWTDSIYYSCAGIAIEYDTGFEPCLVVASASKSGGSLEQVAQHIMRLMREPLIRVAERVRRDNPAEYQKRFIDAQPLQIVLVKIEADIPTFLVIGFNPESLPGGRLTFKATGVMSPGSRERNSDYVLLGQNDAASVLLEKYPKFWESGLVAADAVRFLVSLEVIDKTEDVQPPIDILRITKEGAEWIQKKSECPDIQK